MIAHRILVPSRRVAAAAAMALAASMMVSAASAPVKLVGVSSHDNAVLIESTEPVAYAVSRPDPLTLLVDLRNVSVADARASVVPDGSVAGIKLEQAVAVDGASLARVRMSLTGPSEYQVRSARNTIRVELTPAAGKATAAATSAPAAQTVLSSPLADPGPATLLERVRARRAPGSATVTFSGNGQLVPSSVQESSDAPRRLTLDFPNVSSKADSRVSVDGTLVRKLHISVASKDPLVTRAVLELGDATVYHVERSGPAGRDLDVVFEGGAAAGDRVLLAPADGQPAPPEAPITMAEAMRNVATITPADTAPPEPMSALKAAPAAKPAPASASVPAAKAASASVPAPAAPKVTATPLQQAAGGDQKRFTGHPVSLDFQGADLRAVLRGFSEISGLNMVIDPDVQGTVDIILNEVPWDQALDVILRGNQLDYTVDGTIVRIARVDTLRKEQDSRQALAKSAADAGTLAVRTFSLSYARASGAAPLVKRAVLSARGDVQVDDRTNTLIITDLPAKLGCGQRPARDHRPGRAAGRSRGADRPDQPRLRPCGRYPVGPQWPRDAGHRQHHATGVPEPGHGRRPSRAAGLGRRPRRGEREDQHRRRASAFPAPTPRSASRSAPSTARSTSTSRSPRSSAAARAASSPRRG